MCEIKKYNIGKYEVTYRDGDWWTHKRDSDGMFMGHSNLWDVVMFYLRLAPNYDDQYAVYRKSIAGMNKELYQFIEAVFDDIDKDAIELSGSDSGCVLVMLNNNKVEYENKEFREMYNASQKMNNRLCDENHELRSMIAELEKVPTSKKLKYEIHSIAYLTELKKWCLLTAGEPLFRYNTLEELVKDNEEDDSIISEILLHYIMDKIMDQYLDMTGTEENYFPESDREFIENKCAERSGRLAEQAPIRITKVIEDETLNDTIA
ncbi:hypothetical protein LCGC14_3129710, partial [marine sediment metagenome]